LRNTGEYLLRQGEVAVGDLQIHGKAFARFEQFAGKVGPTNRLILGEVGPPDDTTGVAGAFAHYLLHDGILITPQIFVGTEPSIRNGFDGRFEQVGGSNLAERVQVGSGPGRGS
jgi:hypothetical protein